MIKKSFYLLLPAICLILYGCPKSESPAWANYYELAFKTIRLKVDGYYYPTNLPVSMTASNAALHPETPNDNTYKGSITDFGLIFLLPDYYNGQYNFKTSSHVKAKTVDIYTGDSRSVTHDEDHNSDCVRSNRITHIYGVRNRYLQDQYVDLEIVSGLYKTNADITGKLYWTKTITFSSNDKVLHDIVEIGKFEQNAAFKPISSTPIVVNIYRDAIMVSQAVQMIERTNGMELKLATIQ